MTCGMLLGSGRDSPSWGGSGSWVWPQGAFQLHPLPFLGPDRWALNGNQLPLLLAYLPPSKFLSALPGQSGEGGGGSRDERPTLKTKDRAAGGWLPLAAPLSRGVGFVILNTSTLLALSR